MAFIHSLYLLVIKCVSRPLVDGYLTSSSRWPFVAILCIIYTGANKFYISFSLSQIILLRFTFCTPFHPHSANYTNPRMRRMQLNGWGVGQRIEQHWDLVWSVVALTQCPRDTDTTQHKIQIRMQSKKKNGHEPERNSSWLDGQRDPLSSSIQFILQCPCPWPILLSSVVIVDLWMNEMVRGLLLWANILHVPVK